MMEKQKIKKKLTKKQEKQRQRLLRAGIQVLFFLMFPAVFTSAFGGIKSLAAQVGAGEVPSWSLFLKILVGIGIYTIIFGRFFCGYACAFGSTGDALYALSGLAQKKWKRKLPGIPRNIVQYLFWIKYGILGLVVLLCFFGIYGKLQGTNPWDVFSMLTALRFSFSGYGIGVIILLLIFIGMCFEERFFCKFLCPMGAVFAMLPILPFSSYRRNRENCISKCSACQKQCPVDMEIDGDSFRSGECLQCGKCLTTCPRGNVSNGWKGNEIIHTAVRAVVLLGLCIWLGI